MPLTLRVGDEQPRFLLLAIAATFAQAQLILGGPTKS